MSQNCPHVHRTNVCLLKIELVWGDAFISTHPFALCEAGQFVAGCVWGTWNQLRPWTPPYAFRHCPRGLKLGVYKKQLGFKIEVSLEALAQSRPKDVICKQRPPKRCTHRRSLPNLYASSWMRRSRRHQRQRRSTKTTTKTRWFIIQTSIKTNVESLVTLGARFDSKKVLLKRKAPKSL